LYKNILYPLFVLLLFKDAFSFTRYHFTFQTKLFSDHGMVPQLQTDLSSRQYFSPIHQFYYPYHQVNEFKLRSLTSQNISNLNFSGCLSSGFINQLPTVLKLSHETPFIRFLSLSYQNIKVLNIVLFDS